MNIKVAALMPVRNGESFLCSAIASLEANQGYLSEILIIDDGSEDKTSSILDYWSKSNEKVRVIKTKGIGLVECLNLGLMESASEFIARFDVDDIYSPDRIKIQTRYLTTGVAAVFSDYSFWEQKFGFLGTMPSAIFPNATSISLVNHQRTAHPSVMFSRNAVLDVGGYNKNDFPAEDYSLWLRLSKSNTITSIPEVLLNYRLSAGSISASQRKFMVEKTMQLRNSIGINTDDYRSSIEYLGIALAKYGDFDFARIRKFLHLRDLLSIATEYNFAKSDKKLIVGELLKISLSLNSILDTAPFAAYTFKRRIVRHLL
jgi:glycosyltransferase involved in cell wall biosynthesis